MADLERRLELNPKSWHVSPTSQPATFLGYRVSRAGILPGKKLRRRMKIRLRELCRQSDDKLLRSLHSYRGWMTFG